MSNHSILPPSSAGIWGKSCTGWLKMVGGLPVQPPSMDSLEGDLAHEIGAKELSRASGRMFGAIPMVGEIKEGVTVTQEMADAVKVYVEDILAVMVRGYTALGIEEKLPIPDVHKDCFGTPDCWILTADGVLWVWDFKYGHKFIEVRNNFQMVCYAVGLVRKLNLPSGTKVVLTIVQPRTYTPEGPVRRWETNSQDIWNTGIVISANAHRAFTDQATLITGPHCFYCEARLHCGPALKLAPALLEMFSAPLPVELTPEALGKQLVLLDRAYEHIDSMRDATHEQIKTLMKSGVVVPGWDLEDTYGREAWGKSEEEIFHLGELLRLNLKKAKPITPAQARRAGVPEEVLRKYVNRPHTGLKLVRADANKAARIFGGDINA